MNLYHYSSQLHQTLKTKAVSGSMTDIQVKLARLEARRKPYEAWAYCDHISFFFEPIPSQLLPTLFENHPFWFKGNNLYEYVVDPKTLPSVIPYHVVESVKKTALYDKFVIDNNWVEDDPKLLEEYMILEWMKGREWGEIGKSRSDLIKQIAANQNQIAQLYKEAVLREDFEWNKTKYAANVPHLMLYPVGGEVKPTSVNGLTIGNDKRRPVITQNAL